jgi:hypothetical protein
MTTSSSKILSAITRSLLESLWKNEVFPIQPSKQLLPVLNEPYL